MGYALEKMPDWPLTMNREAALAYMGVADKLFGQLEKTGALTGKRIGRNGEVIYLRDQLDAVTARLFGAEITDIDDEFKAVSGG